MRQLGAAMSVSAQKAGVVAVASGRWLADVVVDAAPRIPVRDLATLRAPAPRARAARSWPTCWSPARSGARWRSGSAGGALTGIQWTLPVSWSSSRSSSPSRWPRSPPSRSSWSPSCTRSTASRCSGTPTQRGAAYALSWANRRGVNPLEPATMAAALGVAARRRVQRRLLARFGRGIGTLAPLMAGAAYGAYSNRRQTQLLADSLRSDLRRRPVMTGLTGAAVVKLLETGRVPSRLRRGRRSASGLDRVGLALDEQPGHRRPARSSPSRRRPPRPWTPAGRSGRPGTGRPDAATQTTLTARRATSAAAMPPSTITASLSQALWLCWLCHVGVSLPHRGVSTHPQPRSAARERGRAAGSARRVATYQ